VYVVEIAVVKANLENRDENDDLECEIRKLNERIELYWLVPKTHEHTAYQSQRHQKALDGHQHQALWRNVLAEYSDHASVALVTVQTRRLG